MEIQKEPRLEGVVKSARNQKDKGVLPMEESWSLAGKENEFAGVLLGPKETKESRTGSCLQDVREKEEKKSGN